MKLDRLIAHEAALGRIAALRAIAAGRVQVDGRAETCRHAPVDRFQEVRLDGVVVQPAQRALYLMMHKPAGWLSATRDGQHPTVLELIDVPGKDELHLAGRLDRASSGLLLLTNDGRWSKRLMAAETKVAKVYRVETLEPIPDDAAEAFARGFYFATEGVTTLPARMDRLGERSARVTLHEGRYHQAKRMFHRVDCRVITLHRERIGGLHLPENLAPGAWRELAPEEISLAQEIDPWHQPTP